MDAPLTFITFNSLFVRFPSREVRTERDKLLTFNSLFMRFITLANYVLHWLKLCFQFSFREILKAYIRVSFKGLFTRYISCLP